MAYSAKLTSENVQMVYSVSRFLCNGWPSCL